MEKSFVFLADGFEEIEALAPVDIMRRAGMSVVTVSINPTKSVIGAHGVKVEADIIFGDEDMSRAEWLILPGGMPGATNLAACEPLCDLLRAQAKRGGNIGAICASPAIVLAPLGILAGRPATCYPGMATDDPAINWDESQRVVADGNIVTGFGPAAAIPFGLSMTGISMGEPMAQQVAQAMKVIP